MKLLIVGTGYVGLVTGACFAEMGHEVICLDIDREKIEKLKQGIIPIYEPTLEEVVERNCQAGRLTFTTDYATGVRQSLFCFLAVPTPEGDDGSCDLSYVEQAAAEIAQHLDGYRVIVNKSTVPVGSQARVKKRVQAVLEERGVSIPFDVVSNPEFLKEGNAVNDFMKPDRIIVGVSNGRVEKLMRELYAPFNQSSDRMIVMDPPSAEMTKYAANAHLAMRISFMNEIAGLCEQVGADVSQVRRGIGSDSRIGYPFLYAGAGYGGSCFPKDVKALSKMAQAFGYETALIDATEVVNERQKRRLFEKMEAYYVEKNGLSGKTFAIWGLAFKSGTDDMREAPSVVLIRSLLIAGANVRLYDPVAMNVAKKQFSQSPQLHFCNDEYDAANQADAIVLVTEWKQFRFVNFEKIEKRLKAKVFFDGRNQYSPKEMIAKGFDYRGIGLPIQKAQETATLSK